MIVLTEVSEPLAIASSHSKSDGTTDVTVHQELQAATAIAKLLGFSIYAIPAAFADAASTGPAIPAAENSPLDPAQALTLPTQPGAIAPLLAHIPTYAHPVPTVWLGRIPSPQHYAAFYAAALDQNLKLLNTPEQHLRIQEFDRAYPYLVGLTPESRAVTTLEQARAGIEDWGLPLVIRAIRPMRTAHAPALSSQPLSSQPLSSQPLSSQPRHLFVASTSNDLERMVSEILSTSGSRVLLRRWVKLRSARTTAAGFPMGREFYVILYHQRVLTYGYCWEGEDDQCYLSTPEEEALFAVARTAAARLEVPFVAIALGQLEDGNWIVINTRDPQFGGLGQVPLIQFWHEMAEG